ncbi:MULTISPECIES: ATP-binding protein [Cetobacterium]|jgi:serine/threonine-protein kinase RsbW|uniref:ATP-binding protein n=1 Tax=Candidatus Cetobacterium colombiensis TaxID=3073100 RepID=A0ABU4WAC7_9FUSO|nr:ATP-binding protein [Candidatus Cetobacterium colombiensis]MDX8336492.1 ATP-binding protein [Candidatus Cetobacterium colombiensis]
MQNEIKLYVPSSLKNLSIIRAMTKTYLEHQKVEQKDIMKILSIVDELATNVIEHGYEYKSGDIIIELQKNNDVIHLVVEDNGVGFDESKISKDEGGMGLFLAKAMADNFKVEKKINGTKIKVEKKVKEEI